MDSTLALLDRIILRTSALSHRSDCVTITTGTRDDLGLLPARDACKPIPVDGTSSAVPLPDIPVAPPASQPTVVTPPNLVLRPPAANAVPVPTQAGTKGAPKLPSTRNPGSVLPNPNQPGSEALQPEPWRPLPGHESPKPTAPLPPWILQPRLLPPG
jgi:hypothetical protein